MCYNFVRGAHGVMVIIIRNEYGDSSLNLDEAVCISHNSYTIGKGMHPTILTLSMG